MVKQTIITINYDRSESELNIPLCKPGRVINFMRNDRTGKTITIRECQCAKHMITYVTEHDVSNFYYENCTCSLKEEKPIKKEIESKFTRTMNFMTDAIHYIIWDTRNDCKFFGAVAFYILIVASKRRMMNK